MESHPATSSASRFSRRLLLGGAVLSATAAVAGRAGLDRRVHAAQSARVVTKGRIRQSVCAWCFEKHMSLDELCKNAAAMGVQSVELVDAKDWPTLKKHGLVCALANSHGFVRGFAHKEDHEFCIDILRKRIDECAAAGFPTVITFSGFRKGLPDDVGLENAVVGLKKVIGYAEKKQINLCLEVLNSRVDVEMKGHPDYMADKVEWAVEVCKRIASPRMTFLFDVYHVQIMQGDIITRIKQTHQYIGHYHVAGVPGRNEIDDTQEINYPPIMRTIAETNYKGFVAQEFIPTRDPLESLRQAVRICDV